MQLLLAFEKDNVIVSFPERTWKGRGKQMSHEQKPIYIWLETELNTYSLIALAKNSCWAMKYEPSIFSKIGLIVSMSNTRIYQAWHYTLKLYFKNYIFWWPTAPYWFWIYNWSLAFLLIRSNQEQLSAI